MIVIEAKFVLRYGMGKFSLDKTRDNAVRAISPIIKPQSDVRASGERTEFKGIPHHEYYLIFLLFVDLLNFEYIGPGEKVAYIIPIDFEGQTYAVVYAKFGIKIICPKGGDGGSVYKAIKKGMKAAKPYYIWRAEEASLSSNLNLISKCPQLWEKYVYLRKESVSLNEKFEEGKDKSVIEKGFNDDGSLSWSSISYPAYEFRTQSLWLHEAAVDAFFAWCEQALVHLAVLMGKLTNGKEITDLLKREFGEKCKLVFDLSDMNDKFAYDDILDLRTHLRNYVAHGSFGKDGSTFEFHSRVGAVPLKILDDDVKSRFSFGTDNSRNWEKDYVRIEKFLEQLWFGDRKPAKLHIETNLPCILTYVSDGKYSQAMRSEYEMEIFIDNLHRCMDDAANMDF